MSREKWRSVELPLNKTNLQRNRIKGRPEGRFKAEGHTTRKKKKKKTIMKERY